MYRYFVLMVFYIFIFNVDASDTQPCANHHCIAFVNAGSSGSRLFIYSFNLDKTETPTHIKKIWENLIKPGISTIEHQPQAVSSYLDKLFKKAPTQQVPVYFYATAGMRLLSQKKSEKAYSLINEWFNKHNEWKLMEARTISGEEEGLFGWLAVNYGLNRLKQDSKSLVAVIDIGGASTQISIPLSNEQKIDKEGSNLYSFTLYDKKINIFSFSFLGLGVNELTSHFDKMASCYSQGYPLNTGAKGTGMMPQCIRAMSKEINTHFALTKVQKLIANYYSKEWYLIGGFTAIFQSKAFALHDKLNAQEVLNLAEKNVCRPKWSSLQKKYGKNIYLSKLCTLSSYWYSLLVNGYKINSKQVVHFFPPDSAPDWSIGALLAHYKK